jgi:predicted nucleic acid binding AN1-type Zn finger protein
LQSNVEDLKLIIAFTQFIFQNSLFIHVALYFCFLLIQLCIIKQINKTKNKNIMQHRITLSTDLLIAVRDKHNEAKRFMRELARERMIKKDGHYISPYANDAKHFTLYGHEHAEAV